MAQYLLCFKTSWEPQEELPDVSIQEEMYYHRINQMKAEDVDSGEGDTTKTPSYPVDTHLTSCCNNPVESSQSSVPEEVDRHHGFSKKERTLDCSICAKSHTKSTTKQHADRHLLTHSREKPFTCSICSKSFVTKTEAGGT